MTGKYTPSLIARAYADPLSWLNLAVDLLPIWAIFQFGWGATPLVALYWLENLVIGLFAAARMLGAGLTQLSKGMIGGAAVFFLVPFFCVHYGAFCWGHGVFIANFSNQEIGLPSPQGLITWALGTGPHMLWFLGAILAANLAVFLTDFIARGEITRARLDAEMTAPYGRIVTLHVAIILGAMFAFGTDEPLMGVLLLILIRVTFGMILAIRRRMKRDRQLAERVDGKAATV
ncbi:DUF6498-containing protein [Hyphomonas sp. NPDC076900]|uniref:DUF6498-containing protein n=1 Tax=unclassified Hyphomonas TaxID=2630699 RepID=UPI003CFFA092